jgi:hypothetical protein
MKVVVTPKRRRHVMAERHEDRISWKREELASASVALIRVQECQTPMGDKGIKRAEVARRYGPSRASK